MKTHIRYALRMAAACFLCLTGCDQLQSLLSQKPSARVVGVGLDDIGLDSATLGFNLEIKNPYAVPLPLVNLDYGLASLGKPFLSGRADLQGTVPAGGTRTVKLPAKIGFAQLLGVLKDKEAEGWVRGGRPSDGRRRCPRFHCLPPSPADRG